MVLPLCRMHPTGYELSLVVLYIRRRYPAAMRHSSASVMGVAPDGQSVLLKAPALYGEALHMRLLDEELAVE